MREISFYKGIVNAEKESTDRILGLSYKAKNGLTPWIPYFLTPERKDFFTDRERKERETGTNRLLEKKLLGNRSRLDGMPVPFN